MSIELSVGRRIVKIIPERDMYRLIMRSKLPNAERFEEWVVGEVLPSIRKNGAYMTENTLETSLPQAIANGYDDLQCKRV